MSNRTEPFQVTTTAGTAQSAYQVTSLAFNDGRVDRVEIHIPPGPSGLMGFKLAHSNQQVIPPLLDTWSVADDAKFDWDLDGYPQGGAWELWTYNTDVYDHTIYLWFHITDIGGFTTPVVTPVAIEALGTAEDFETSDMEVA